LAGNRTAVGKFPTGSDEVSADRLTVDYERRDRLPELPSELATGIGLALVNLGTLGMDRDDRRLTGSCCNSLGNLRAQIRRRQNRRNKPRSNGDDWPSHGDLPQIEISLSVLKLDGTRQQRYACSTIV